MRRRQPERLRRIRADELDEEAEDPGREQIELQRFPGDRHSVAPADDDERGHDVEPDLVEHRWMHRAAATGADRKRRGGARGHPHAPRQVRRRAQRQLREEAADPPDDRGHRDRQRVGVARGAGVAERALGERDRDVPAGDRPDDALAAVLDRHAERHARGGGDHLGPLPERDEPRAQAGTEDGGERDPDDP